MKGLYKVVEGPSTRPIVLSMINGSYCRRRRSLTIFEPDEMKFGVFCPSLICKLDHCRRLGEGFLLINVRMSYLILVTSSLSSRQRRQGPDLRPLWLLVGTPSAIRPELAFSRAEHSLRYSDVTIYIFVILYLSYMLYVYRFVWPLRLGWLSVVVYIRRFIYKFSNVCPFDYTAVAGNGKVGPVNQVKQTSWVAVVTPTDRPKSVRNLCNRTFLWRCLCCHFALLTFLSV